MNDAIVKYIIIVHSFYPAGFQSIDKKLNYNYTSIVFQII